VKAPLRQATEDGIRGHPEETYQRSQRQEREPAAGKRTRAGHQGCTRGGGRSAEQSHAATGARRYR
jgi:hypothetical protein